MENEFQDRVALVTGGSRGMGRSIALQLAAGGADVAIGYGERRETAEQVVREIESRGRHAICRQCDLRSQEQIDDTVARTRDELGPIDLLVNSGAISNFADHEEMTYELWRDTIDVNLHGVFRILFAVKDEMIERRFGRIVLISSIAAYNYRPQQLHYATSKSGVITMTAWCAEAFGPHNVRVNCIAPGLVDTEMMRVVPEDLIAKAVETTPLRRVGKPGEIAELATFLLSERSSFMTGQTVIASGGRAIRH
ncbi:MAG: SDR family oxidoreductase [Pirellulaceae bacterium]|nr:SDR family oxidoreductase [Pirellulaceae bacterium]MDP7018367.1 SDR family oxidoreductase [Pirellulaceae bacterium]